MVTKRVKEALDSAKNILRKALSSGSSPERLAFSCCMGIYIAFSPFPGMHTVMMVICKYMFDLHFPMLFFATSLNNPWTMIPFFSFDYVFGYWLVHKVAGCNPGWSISLVNVFGSGSVCIWSFLIGGNILGIAAGLMSYPLMLRLFKKFGQTSSRVSL